jgi:predicted transposase/invertase (TIGR01784 family)
MSEIANPHDKFFKETFSRVEIAREFFQHHLPTAVVQTLALDTLTLQPSTFVDPELQEQFADLLYRVQLSQDPNDIAYIYLLLEHKSYNDPLTPFQVLRYMVRIWERDLKEKARLHPIVPIVVYHGQEQWQAATEFGELFTGDEALRRYWPHFSYELRDLSHLSDAEIVGSLQLQIALLLLKYVLDPRLEEHIRDIFMMFRELADAESAIEYLATVLYYIGNAARHLTRPAMVTIVQEILAEEENAVMQTIAESWVEEGRQEGRLEGRIYTLQKNILELLALRFGGFEETLEMQVRDMQDGDRLEAWFRTAATAVSLAEFRTTLQTKEE